MPTSPPPRPQEARLSLINSAPVLDEVAGGTDRWQEEFNFVPEACGDAHVSDPCQSVERVPDARPAPVDVKPFVVWAADRCSTFGFLSNADMATAGDGASDEERAQAGYEARAQRFLERCQSKAISGELWEGTQAQDSGWPNQFLASSDADTLTEGPEPVIDVLACLEQALAQCGCGARGMIHATRQLVTHWAALGPSILRREGGLLLTVHDTIVVSDAGYTGTGPNGEPASDSIWAYATGMVNVRLSAIELLPARFADAVDRSLNIVDFYAQREASVFWDGCCHFAAEANLAACAFGGTS